jgi:hypothetical protein
VFNLAALLGLSALVAGRVRFHRRVILLGGIPGIWIAVACLLTVARVLPPVGGLAVAALALAPYAGLLAARRSRAGRLPLPGAWAAWLAAACARKKPSWPRRSGPPQEPGATGWPPPRRCPSW